MDESRPASAAGRAARLELDALRWLAGIDDASQFTCESVAAAFGMELPPLDPRRERYGKGEALDGDWSYGLLLDRSQPRPRFELSFRPRTPDGPSMRAIPGVDADAASRQLLEAGFERAEVRAEHGRLDHYRFSRAGLTVELYVRGESAENPGRQRIRALVAR